MSIQDSRKGGRSHPIRRKSNYFNRKSRLTPPRIQDGFFLFSKLRYAMTSKPKFNNNINASYVLISTSLPQDPEREARRLSGCLQCYYNIVLRPVKTTAFLLSVVLVCVLMWTSYLPPARFPAGQGLRSSLMWLTQRTCRALTVPLPGLLC